MKYSSVFVFDQASGIISELDFVSIVGFCSVDKVLELKSAKYKGLTV